ncbi:acyltransferase domain-containing protein [Streptosporangium sp. NBC_01755]|uniref:beta-ketoacyl synthase N-terminal-like domain-containing protein n=1 Tax=unclassified Streptosporangium TaxID=2632669 RepID=UPI002DDA30C5|nr:MULTISPECIES: beta-ketoacyl synthase N-terminal-like domain-containing protein [unclassified Streptosporangium]WSA28341.1 acyltransferase domain-containing protein [Streptosporangium sp. NBC_01810]WSD00181.1 acyltransferase domain-containing protein [Streptosporangium sp. NBC_01755]
MSLLDLLTSLVAERAGLAAVDADRLFIDYGIGSADAVALATELEARLGTPLPNTVFYDHPTPRALAEHLAGAVRQPDPPLPNTVLPDRDTSRASEGPLRQPDRETPAYSVEPVAIVGIGCRLPGADGPGRLWRLLADGVDAVGTVPGERAAHHPGWREPGVGEGGFLPDVEGFDPAFFTVNAREAEAMDPQQRMLLEVAHESLQDAGLRLADLAGSQTGVFAGISSGDFLVRSFSPGPAAAEPGLYTPTGVAHSVAANRISYVFDLHGPSMSVDTACSSSLVAVHQAVTALRTGQCDTALAGGVNAILSPDIGLCFRTAGVLAPDGRCRSFGAGADGMGRSEGAVMVTLRRLGDAIAAGDRIYALILGGAVNSDGRTNGLMSPSAPAQVRLLRAACRAAGVDPGDVGYVEAHGSGTRLGDLMELRALSEVLGTAPRRAALRIGSVKSNLGHLEAAAGAAGLAKLALALFHGTLPASLHATDLAEDFDWSGGGLRVQRSLEPWAGRLAGVSSFGFGGTNAHLILQAPPERRRTPVTPVTPVTPGGAPARRQDWEDCEGGPPAETWSYPPTAVSRTRHYLPLSAHTHAGLRELVVRWRTALDDPELDLVAACHTAGERRDHHAYRVGVTGADAAELSRELDRALTDLAAATLGGAAPGGLALVFADEPAAGTAAVHADLAAELRRAGVRPDLVIGHGAGEVAAARYRGVLSLTAADAVAGHRARLLAGPAPVHALRVRLARRLAEALCARIGPALAVATVEDAQTCVIVGPRAALATLAATLTAGDVLCGDLGPATADHSALAAPLAAELELALEGLPVNAGETVALSTLTGGPIDGHAQGAWHWARHLVTPSLLGDALAVALDRGVRTFVEIGAAELGPRLRGAPGGRQARVVRCATASDLPGVLIRLYELGHDLDWAALNPPGAVASIPLLPWSRERPAHLPAHGHIGTVPQEMVA